LKTQSCSKYTQWVLVWMSWYLSIQRIRRGWKRWHKHYTACSRRSSFRSEA